MKPNFKGVIAVKTYIISTEWMICRIKDLQARSRWPHAHLKMFWCDKILLFSQRVRKFSDLTQQV